MHICERTIMDRSEGLRRDNPHSQELIQEILEIRDELRLSIELEHDLG